MKIQNDSEATSPFVGDNLLLLMGLSPDCCVLAIGEKLGFWKSLFRICRTSIHVPEQIAGEDSCGLILYHSSSATTARTFGADMKRAREILGKNGSILVFTENPTSFGNFRKLKRGEFGTLLGKLRLGYSRCEQELRRAGYGDVRRFYPLPGLEQTDELVAVGSQLLELPHYWHQALHFANKLGVFHLLAEGLVFHAGGVRLESGALVSCINAEVARKSDRHGVQCVLERLDIRSRGALVLFLKDEYLGNRIIARIVSDKSVDKIVSKNHDFLNFLHTISGLSEAFKILLPRQLCRIEYFDSTIYVETMIEGTVAWKVNRKELKEKVFHDAIEFLYGLSLATRNLKRLEEHDLDTVFQVDLSRMINSEVIEPSFREEMTRLINNLKQQLQGQEIFLVASHGDYGYGNILVDPDNGDLKGVIDWDTGKKQDLPGIDLFNFFYQKERMVEQCGLLDAFNKVVPVFVFGPQVDTCTTYFEELRIEDDLKKIIVYAGFIRDVSRSAQYPEHFVGTQREYQAIYEYLSEIIPL